MNRSPKAGVSGVGVGKDSGTNVGGEEVTVGGTVIALFAGAVDCGACGWQPAIRNTAASQKDVLALFKVTDFPWKRLVGS